MSYHHPAEFGGHRHCDSGDMRIVICQAISQDHMIKGSFDFMLCAGAHQGRLPPSQICVAIYVAL